MILLPFLLFFLFSSLVDFVCFPPSVRVRVYVCMRICFLSILQVTRRHTVSFSVYCVVIDLHTKYLFFFIISFFQCVQFLFTNIFIWNAFSSVLYQARTSPVATYLLFHIFFSPFYVFLIIKWQQNVICIFFFVCLSLCELPENGRIFFRNEIHNDWSQNKYYTHAIASKRYI